MGNNLITMQLNVSSNRWISYITKTIWGRKLVLLIHMLREFKKSQSQNWRMKLKAISTCSCLNLGALLVIQCQLHGWDHKYGGMLRKAHTCKQQSQTSVNQKWFPYKIIVYHIITGKRKRNPEDKHPWQRFEDKN